ncbi:MAG: NAD-dependent epimerase/dehydratase family protein [Candidatus Omnitrophica bacterium]|nr:NAD-dependent epimerase/dehydratase family protein [Candidatus Omnitrophota bacterium]
MKKIFVLITGSLGLIGFETVKFFLGRNYPVVGIDNGLRAKIFGIKTNYQTKLKYLKTSFKGKYTHFNNDIRDGKFLDDLVKNYGKDINLIIHAAAQTSHDWSAKDPKTDFYINALATYNLLEAARKYCPNSVFIFTSTNKVYGDRVNYLPLKEFNTRFDLEKNNQFYNGIPESFSIDQSIHSPFGVSKTSADLMVQEYGRYFGLKTTVFRLGVVSGSSQEGALEQGFLSFMIKKMKNNEPFTIIGYKGKQVRDIIHSIDVVSAFWEVFKKPKKGEVYNLGGGRGNAFSVIELINKVEKLTGRKLKLKYEKRERKGDHKWWITDFSKFKREYPQWGITKSVDDIILDIYKNDISG